MKLQEYLGDIKAPEDVLKKFGDSEIIVHKAEEKYIKADENIIPKSRFDEVNTSMQHYKTQVDELTNKISTFEGLAGDKEKLSKELTDTKTKLQETESNFQTQLLEVKKESLMDINLIRDKVKSTKAAKVFFNMDEIKVDGDKLLGYDSQKAEIEKNNPWLFGEDKKPGADEGRYGSGHLNTQGKKWDDFTSVQLDQINKDTPSEFSRLRKEKYNY